MKNLLQNQVSEFLPIFTSSPETKGKTLDEIQAGFASPGEDSSLSQPLLGDGSSGIYSHSLLSPLVEDKPRRSYQSFADV